MKKKVGSVTEAEKDQILKLYERKSALNDLVMVLEDSQMNDQSKNGLYEKIVSDMGSTTSIFEHWWKTMSQKYLWESSENGKWEIDFDTNEIYLINYE